MDRQPSSLVNSLASEAVSQKYSWDLMRFGPMPTGGDPGGDPGGKQVPTGPNGEEGTYDGRSDDECTNPGESTNSTSVVSSLIHDVAELTVFGDPGCSYDAIESWKDPTADPDPGDLLGTITCTEWKDAKCYQADSLAVQDCSDSVFDFPMAYCNWE